MAPTTSSDTGPRTPDIGPVVNRICLWSGPRNVSTAVMYAFAQRRDTRVLDEPLYGHYLRVSGADHPGREEVMAAQNCDGDAVMREIVLGPCDRDVVFVKQMAHHLVEIDLSFLSMTQNAFLIRDPEEMLPSLEHQIPNATLRDTGLEIQASLYDRLVAIGQQPPVLEARALLQNPSGVLTKFCEKLQLDFDANMLAWKAGGLPEDGAWAPYWYHSIHSSEGFTPYKPKTNPFPARLQPLLDLCRPYYEYLNVHAIR